ncbi:MAG: sigma-54 dependent transcriptional regulator, partial [uncultured Nocardioides sp.]
RRHRPGRHRRRRSDGGGVPPRQGCRRPDDARGDRPLLRPPQARHRRRLPRLGSHTRAHRPGQRPLSVRRGRTTGAVPVSDDVQRLRRDRRPQQRARCVGAPGGADRGGRPGLPRCRRPRHAQGRRLPCRPSLRDPAPV